MRARLRHERAPHRVVSSDRRRAAPRRCRAPRAARVVAFRRGASPPRAVLTIDVARRVALRRIASHCTTPLSAPATQALHDRGQQSEETHSSMLIGLARTYDEPGGAGAGGDDAAAAASDGGAGAAAASALGGGGREPIKSCVTDRSIVRSPSSFGGRVVFLLRRRKRVRHRAKEEDPREAKREGPPALCRDAARRARRADAEGCVKETAPRRRASHYDERVA